MAQDSGAGEAETAAPGPIIAPVSEIGPPPAPADVTVPPPMPEHDGTTTSEAGAVMEETLSSVTEEDSEDAAAAYNRKLLSVEDKVNDLKERVFRSKATLQLLREIVVQGASHGARAVLWHENQLGSTYTVESISYYLDGQPIYSRVDEQGSLDQAEEIKLHDGAIPPGNHNVSVSIVLRGNGFGIFNYVDQYTFKVQSSYAFVAEDSKTCEVRVRMDERKGIGRTFVERPQVLYEMQCVRTGQE
jgi:hypothetical protein